MGTLDEWINHPAPSLSKAPTSLPGFHLVAGGSEGEGEVTMFQAVIIRLLCQMNVSASLQTAVVEPPSIMSYSSQPLVRANKILLTNFYLAFVRRLSRLATPNCFAHSHSYKYDEPIQN